jgi:hypothetical protein
VFRKQQLAVCERADPQKFVDSPEDTMINRSNSETLILSCRLPRVEARRSLMKNDNPEITSSFVGRGFAASGLEQSLTIKLAFATIPSPPLHASA